MSSILAGETSFEIFTASPARRMTGSAKDQIADVVRPLVVHIGWYHRRYGDSPQEELLRMVRAKTLTEETEALLLHGMHSFVSALGEVRGVGADRADDAVH